MSMPAVVFVRDIRKPQPITILVNGSPEELTLHPIDKLILHTLASYVSHDQKRIAWPSLRTLAADCWASERSVQRSLSRLEKVKLLHRETGGGKSTTTYRITGFSPGAGGEAPPVSPVTPPPVIRDTPPVSPVTPPNKEYESTCEKTVKGEPPAPPLALSTEDFARRILDDVHLPDLPTNRKPVVAAIDCEVRSGSGSSTLAAYEFIRAGCQEAMSEGFGINSFFFQDAKYRAENRRKPNGTERLSTAEVRSMRSKENILRGLGLSVDTWNSNTPNGYQLENPDAPRVGSRIQA